MVVVLGFILSGPSGVHPYNGQKIPPPPPPISSPPYKPFVNFI
jgi:hypothetical protein